VAVQGPFKPEHYRYWKIPNHKKGEPIGSPFLWSIIFMIYIR
jgi:hypothetical protein